MRRGDDGQATVEAALLLPIVLVIIMAVAQVGLVVRDQVLVTHAAREGARMSAVTGDAALVRAAVLDAVRIDADRLRVDIRRRDGVGGVTTVRVTMHELTAAPLVGRAVRSREVAAEASMLVEAAGPPTTSARFARSELDEREDLDGPTFVQRLVAVPALG